MGRFLTGECGECGYAKSLKTLGECVGECGECDHAKSLISLRASASVETPYYRMGRRHSPPTIRYLSREAVSWR